MTLFRDETFGPVVAISRFSSEDEVVAARQRQRLRPELSASGRATPSAAASSPTRLQAGTVNVNEGYAAAWASVDAPMGGMKASGLGRRHGADGIQKYTEEQTIAVQRLLPIAPPQGHELRRLAARHDAVAEGAAPHPRRPLGRPPTIGACSR